jgi:hypothetical protein
MSDRAVNPGVEPPLVEQAAKSLVIDVVWPRISSLSVAETVPPP